jgi:hypothetical protein
MHNDEVQLTKNEDSHSSSFVIWTSSLVSCIPGLPGRRDAPSRRPVVDPTAKRPSTRPTQ